MLGSYAFKGCSGITSIGIPHSVNIIEDYAFEDCTGLTSVIIGRSLSWIGREIFKNCPIVTVMLYADKPPRVEPNSFNSQHFLLKVPSYSIDMYEGNPVFRELRIQGF